MSDKANRTLFLISGPCGVGKGDMVNRYCRENTEYSRARLLTTDRGLASDIQGCIYMHPDAFNPHSDFVYIEHKKDSCYGITREQLDNADFCVLPKKGMQQVLTNYTTTRKITCLYIFAPSYVRLKHLIQRKGKSGGIKQFIYSAVFQRVMLLYVPHNLDVVMLKGNKDKDEFYQQFKAIVLTYYLADKTGVLKRR